MVETIQKGFRYECVKEGKVGTILAILRSRFENVPDDIISSLDAMNDPTALDSLAVHAGSCTSLKDFADSL